MVDRRDPFRLRVLKAICAQIKTVSPERTYKDPVSGDDVPFANDLRDYTEGSLQRERVFRGRELFGTNDPLPMVSVLEHPSALDAMLAPAQDSQTIGDWQLLVQGFVVDDPAHPTDPAHILCAEVIAALSETAKQRYDILGLGHQMPCVTKMIIGKPVVRPADAVNSDQAFFWLTLTLTLAEDVEKPFA